MSSFPPVTWITNGVDFSDYRPAIGPDGATVVFERAGVLYQLVIGSGQNPVPFLPDLTGGQTRPAWNWPTDQIAFNVGQNNSLSVYTVPGNGGTAVAIANTKAYIYPQWGLSGFTVMNSRPDASPQPCTTQISSTGSVLQNNVNGQDAAGDLMYGGMPAVNLAANPFQSGCVAFAGQPTLWNPKAYNQSENYIFLNSYANSKYSSSPMEPGAASKLDKFDPSFQGRAPAWSPNGRYIVFESDRLGGYALFLFDTQSQGQAIQLTDPTQNPAQHAKFYPGGTQLIFCANPTPKATKLGIASIDISQYVS